MELIPIQTKLLNPGQDLFENIVEALELAGVSLVENDILSISSKLFSYSENTILECNDNFEFEKLVKKESEKYFTGKVVDLSYKYGLWIANAGIDKSNVENGKVILWVKNPDLSVWNLRERLLAKFNLKNLGIMMVDSICQPGRMGVTGGCIAYQGFIGVTDERGSLDIYGNPLKITKVNKADALAAASNLLMGESGEKRPYCIIRNSQVDFISTQVESITELSMPLEDCIFNAIYK